MEMSLGQGSLAEGVMPEWLGRDERLERIDAAVDWDAVGGLLSGLRGSRDGRPGFPVRTMVKVLLLEQWIGAGDEVMERRLRTDLSYRRFAGLGIEHPGPDHSTISRFRTLLSARGLAEAVFDEINRQLEDAGMVLKRGTIADSTIVDAAPRRSAPGDAPGDPDAMPANPGSHLQGYKVHIGMDQGSQVVRKVRVVQASENDLTAPAEMIVGDEEAFYTDRGYSGEKLSNRLRELGIKDRTMRRARKGRGPLVRWEKRRNDLIKPLRAPVESVFGVCKRSLGMRRARYLGHAKVEAEMLLKFTAYNLLRLDRMLRDAARA